MKKKIVVITGLFLITCISSGSYFKLPDTNPPTEDSITVLSTPDLFDLTLNWAFEYNKLTEKKIRVVSTPEAELGKSLVERRNIAFITGSIPNGFTGNEWKMIVARNVIVPVINANNPFAEEIFQKGISPSDLASFFNDQNSKWGALLNTGNEKPANFYFTNDGSLLKYISQFIGVDQEKIKGREFESKDDLLSAIRKDPGSIAFCRLTDVFDPVSNDLNGNIKFLPIDRNNNGILEDNENIYSDLNSFERGVWIGKYPKSLFSNIYTISYSQPLAESDFLRWILNEGQQYLYFNGYSSLLFTERQTNSDMLSQAKLVASPAPASGSIFRTLFFSLVGLIVAAIILNSAFRLLRRKPSVRLMENPVGKGIDEDSVILPKGLYFDKTHSWAFMEQNGLIKVGVDDFLQHLTGRLTRVKLKKEGEQIRKGEEILSIIQNGKQLSIYSPVSGIIREINTALEKDASMINHSPYIDGWAYRIEPSSWSRENQLLFMADRHRQFIKNEIAKLKEFLTGLISSENLTYAQVVLQDGGALADNTLEHMGPEIWEEFQTRFIDPSRVVWFYEII
jgi:glycine cleavage system H lipoate-binding protein